MQTTETRALTIGVIAEQLGIPLHRVEYLIKSRDIRPVQRAGHLRVFDATALDALRKEIRMGRRQDRRAGVR